ncbi:hypothetical protein PMAYCL1PPCAC_20457, partial [Pristionchus mayeri]
YCLWEKLSAICWKPNHLKWTDTSLYAHITVGRLRELLIVGDVDVDDLPLHQLLLREVVRLAGERSVEGCGHEQRQHAHAHDRASGDEMRSLLRLLASHL